MLGPRHLPAVTVTVIVIRVVGEIARGTATVVAAAGKTTGVTTIARGIMTATATETVTGTGTEEEKVTEMTGTETATGLRAVNRRRRCKRTVGIITPGATATETGDETTGVTTQIIDQAEEKAPPALPSLLRPERLDEGVRDLAHPIGGHTLLRQ